MTTWPFFKSETLRLIILFLLLSFMSYSQSVTFECYVSDTLDNADCAVCNKPGDIEVFTGVIVDKGATRTKIFYPYGFKLRGNEILLFDNKAHNVYFNLDSTEFANYDELLMWFKMCHFPDKQFVDSLFIDGDSLGVSISNSDIIKKVLLPTGLVDTDTDEQKIDTFYSNNDSIYIKIENDPRTWAAPITYDIIGDFLDTQKIRTFRISNDTIYIRIDSDTTHYAIIPNGFDTDQQYFDSVSFTLDTFRFSLVRDTQSLFEIPFNKYLDNTDSQRVIVFNRINDTLFLQLSNDTIVFTLLPETDTQRIVLFTRVGDTIKIQIDNDSIHTLILPTDVDTDTDLQYFDSVSFINDTLIFSIIRDGQPLFKIPFSKFWQYVDTFDIVGGLLRIGLKYDNMPLKTVNLAYYEPQIYIHSGTTTYTNTLSNGGGAFTLSATNNLSITHNGTGGVVFNVPHYTWGLNATNDAWGATTINTGTSITLDGINGIRTQLTANGGTTMTLDGVRLQWYLSGNTGSMYLIGDWTGSETVNIIGEGRITTRTAFNGLGSDSLIISVSEGDSSITNEIQTIDTFSVKQTTKGDSIYISLSQDNQSYKRAFLNKHLDSVWFNNTTDSLFLRVRDTTLKVKIPSDTTDNDNYVDTFYFGSNDTLIIGRTGTLPDLKVKIVYPVSVDNYVDTSFLNGTYDTLTIGRNILADLKIRFPYRDSQTLSIVGIDSLKISRGNTIKLPTYTDNYVDSVTFNTSNRILYLGRTGVLATLSDTIPDANTDQQYLDSAFILNNNLILSIFGDQVNASSISLSSYNQGYVHTGTNFYTNTLTNGGANNAFTLLGSTGVILSHNNSITTFRAADSSATNEIQHFSTVGLVHGLTQSSSTLTFASANANMIISQSGTAANSTLTFNVVTPTDNDNYVTGATFNDSQDSLLITRNILSTIRLKIPDTDSQSLSIVGVDSIKISRGNTIKVPSIIDHDWYNYRTKLPPTAITDTIYTKNFVGINDTTPDVELDVQGVVHIRNKNGIAQTELNLNWDASNSGVSDYVYHIDYNRNIGDIGDFNATYQGYIDYHLWNAYPNVTTATYGEMKFGIAGGNNTIYNPLVLWKDTALVTNGRFQGTVQDNQGDKGKIGSIFVSTAIGVNWDTLKAGTGILINNSNLTISLDTTFVSGEQDITAYIVGGDTIGFLLSKSLGVFDTVIFWGDSVGSGGGGATYTFSHVGGTSLISTLSPSAGSISITPGTQIDILGTSSGINGTAKVSTNFNACQTCVGYFGANAGFTNDSVITDVVFKYYYDEGFGTLEVPKIVLSATNSYANPVALYILSNNDEQVYTSSVDASGFSNANFYHRVSSPSTITLPSTHTGPTTHYFINDGVGFSLQMAGGNTIDGGLSIQSFLATQKLIIVTNDGSGKWYTNKEPVSAASSNISYFFAPNTAPQNIGTTSLSDLQNSTSPTIPVGRYIVKVKIRNHSWGPNEGYKLALTAVTGSSTLVVGNWTVYDCNGTTINMTQESMGVATTINSGISCDFINMIKGECDITVNTPATLKIQLSVETSGRDCNIWNGTVEFVKIG